MALLKQPVPNYANQPPLHASMQAFFHGEAWYKCPHCNTSFEVNDVITIKKESGKDIIYACPLCKGRILL